MKKHIFAVSLIVVLLFLLAACGEDKTPYFADDAALEGTTWTHLGAPGFVTQLDPDHLATYPATAPVNIVIGPGGTWVLQIAAGQALDPGLPAGAMATIAGGTFAVYGDGVMFTVLNPPEAAVAGMGSLPAGFKTADTLVLTEQAGGVEFTKATGGTMPHFASDAALAGTTWTHAGAPAFLSTLDPAFAGYPTNAPVNIIIGPNGTWELQVVAQAPVGEMTSVASGTITLMGDVVLLIIPGASAETTVTLPAAFISGTTLKLTTSGGVGGSEFTKL